ncbi:hypothetical protein OPV22_035184 [Ensete ventricosum]|uniref:Uncharacterized protein n=1 Tax=Ensete ventricosum TaxID=4639 RepID=A0AAX5NIL3_ENSVE|nr:hypothetical protein OPV22_035184 [Ensete ventricosum]
MLDDLDSFDDILLPTTTTTERRPGKFRPRPLAKTANLASTTPKNSDATQLPLSTRGYLIEKQQQWANYSQIRDHAHIMQVIKQLKTRTELADETVDDGLVIISHDTVGKN